MVDVPVPTVERPLTPIDYLVPLAHCSTLDDIVSYAQRCPEDVRNDERFTRAVARRLGEIKSKRAAA